MRPNVFLLRVFINSKLVPDEKAGLSDHSEKGLVIAWCVLVSVCVCAICFRLSICLGVCVFKLLG